MSSIINLAPYNDFLPLCPFCGKRPLEKACDHLQSFIEIDDPEEGNSRIVYLSPNFQEALKEVVGAEFEFKVDTAGPPERSLNSEYYFVEVGDLYDSKHLAELSSSMNGAITFQQRIQRGELTRSITFAITEEQYNELIVRNDEIRSFQFTTESRTVQEYRKQCLPLGSDTHYLNLEESQTLEFKQTFSIDTRTGQVSRELRRAAVREICGFLNTSSGDLIIGVKDQNREIVGIEIDDFKDTDKYALLVMDQIKNLCGPTAASLVDVQFLKISEKTICILKCKKSNEPVYCKFDGTRQVPFIRYGSSTIQPDYEEWMKFLNIYFSVKA